MAIHGFFRIFTAQTIIGLTQFLSAFWGLQKNVVSLQELDPIMGVRMLIFGDSWKKFAVLIEALI